MQRKTAQQDSRRKSAVFEFAQSEAQFALGADAIHVSSSVLSAAMQRGRGLSAGISSGRRHQGTGGLELCRDRARMEARSGCVTAWASLATIGATAPFVGLFGTVWGIMNSFIGISKAQTTNLAVVAPGIAEALLATAFGLVAAIPAVIIYNHFTRVTKGYLELVRPSVGRGRNGCCRAILIATMPVHWSARIRARRSNTKRIAARSVLAMRPDAGRPPFAANRLSAFCLPGPFSVGEYALVYRARLSDETRPFKLGLCEKLYNFAHGTLQI